MADPDQELDQAVQAAVYADHPESYVVGWLTAAVHLRPDGEVAVWWASGDMNNPQISALAASLIEELGGSTNDH